MRHEQLSVGDLTVDNLIGDGALRGWRNKYYLNGSLGSDGNDGLAFDRPLKTLTAATAKLESLKKDLIIFEEAAASVSLSAALTWDESLCGLIGTSASRAYQRSRIGQSAAVASLLTVSGYGNQFANFRVMHGTASTTNKIALTITGAGNSFYNVNIATTNTTVSAQSDFKMVYINNTDESYFEKCVFGTMNAAQAAGALVHLVGGSMTAAHFKDCVFLMNASANAAFFIQYGAGVGEGFTIFENCKFINSGTTLTYGIDGTGLNNHQVFLDATCSFYGVTDIVAAANEACVISGCGSSATPDEDVSWHIALPVDHTA